MNKKQLINHHLQLGKSFEELNQELRKGHLKPLRKIDYLTLVQTELATSHIGNTLLAPNETEIIYEQKYSISQYTNRTLSMKIRCNVGNIEQKFLELKLKCDKLHLFLLNYDLLLNLKTKLLETITFQPMTDQQKINLQAKLDECTRRIKVVQMHLEHTQLEQILALSDNLLKFIPEE